VNDVQAGSYRRIATEEAFSVPEVFAALQGWVAGAGPDEPDQDFLSFLSRKSSGQCAS
jgi:hypothetical protein